jgi:DNA-binding transcriptional ArsR family regulator
MKNQDRTIKKINWEKNKELVKTVSEQIVDELKKQNGLTKSDLTAKLLKSHPTITSAITRLRYQGRVRPAGVVKNKNNRATTIWELTPAGDVERMAKLYQLERKAETLDKAYQLVKNYNDALAMELVKEMVTVVSQAQSLKVEMIRDLIGKAKNKI